MSAMNRTGFDFVGELVSTGPDWVVLKNALAIEFTEERTVCNLMPFYLPAGSTDMQKGCTELRIPQEGIAYVVTLGDDTDSPILQQYRAFFEASVEELDDTGGDVVTGG